jgi:hypothetical protein
MSISLAEALQHVDLHSGQTYSEKVNGHTVEVRVLDDSPTPELADQVMLQPWVEFPFHAVATAPPNKVRRSCRRRMSRMNPIWRPNDLPASNS